MRRIAVLVLAVVACVVVLVTFMGQGVTQPIAFNHHLHVTDQELECVDCHLYALEGVRATIPNLEICIDCHEEAQGQSLEEAKVVEHIADGLPIPWQRVFWVPDHVYFSHRRHTEIAGIECQVCHGDVQDRVEALTKPIVRLTMGKCMDCHYEEGVSNDCINCHR